VAHYVSLAREADGPIVELMVGSGRVAIEVVRQTGKPVLGIDSSPAMLEIARERSAGLPLELRLGDVRDLQLDEPAALIYVPFRSLLHLSGYVLIARLYDPWSASVVEDVSFYVDEALAAGGEIVELAVGPGRIAIPTALAGAQVIGIDSSPGMLAVCAERAREAGVAERL